LVNMSKGKKRNDKPLPSIQLIQNEVDKQQTGKDSHRLVDTNLVIMGKGTNVSLTSAEVLQALDQRTDITRVPPPAPTPAPTVAPTPPPAVADIGPTPTIQVDEEEDSPRTEESYGRGGHPLTSPLVINNPQDFSQHRGIGSVKIVSNDSVTIYNMIKVSDTTSNHGRGQISINSGVTSGPAISITSSAQ